MRESFNHPLLMRTSAERNWLLVLGLCWLLSVAATIAAGHRPGLRHPAEAALPYPYPVSGVVFTTLHTLLYAAITFAIVRNGSAMRALAGAGVAIAALVVHTLRFGTDAPDFDYVPMRFTLLLILVCVLGASILAWRQRANRVAP